jgi:hypothetical protein
VCVNVTLKGRLHETCLASKDLVWVDGCRGWPQESRTARESCVCVAISSEGNWPPATSLVPVENNSDTYLIMLYTQCLCNYTCKTIKGCMRPRNRGSILSSKTRFFSCAKFPDELWGPHNLLFNAKWEFFPCGVKLRGRNHSPPSSVEVKYEWSHTSTAPYAFVAHNGIALLFLMHGTWEFHIHCTGFWGKCENCHNGVSEQISATIPLFRHNK